MAIFNRHQGQVLIWRQDTASPQNGALKASLHGEEDSIDRYLPNHQYSIERARSASEMANEFVKKLRAVLEGVDGDEFVGGVGLVDAAGADADAGNTTAGEVGGVGKPRGAREFGSLAGVEQSLDARMARRGFHRWVFVGVDDFKRQFVVGNCFA